MRGNGEGRGTVRWAGSLILVAVMAFLSGCASLEDASRIELTEEVSVPDSWESMLYGEAGISGSGSGMGWLEGWESPAFRDWMERVVSRNFDLRQSWILVQNAWLEAGLDRSQLLPNVSLGLDGSRRQTRNEAFDPPLANRSDSFSLGAQVRWEIDLLGQLEDRRKASAREAFATENDYRYAWFSLQTRAASLWLEGMAQVQYERLSLQTLENYETATRLIEERYREGTISALDLRLARANTESVRAGLQASRQSLRNFLRTLGVLAGGGRVEESSLDQAFPDLTGRVAAGMPSDLLENRPDIRAAMLRLEASGYRERSAVKAYFPTFSLTAGAGTASEDLNNLLDGDFSVWSLAGSVVQPLFEGGRIRAAANLASNNQDLQLARTASVWLEALREVADALEAEELLKLRQEALARYVEESVGAATLALAEYQSGLVDVITVLEAQRRAFDAQERLIAVNLERYRNRLQLHLALGAPTFPEPSFP